jgi:hypothetical protein
LRPGQSRVGQGGQHSKATEAVGHDVVHNKDERPDETRYRVDHQTRSPRRTFPRQPLAYQLSGEIQQCLRSGGGPHLADDEMPVDGEVRVVDPDRAAASRRKSVYSSTEPRNRGHSFGHQGAKVRSSRATPVFEHQDRAGVHGHLAAVGQQYGEVPLTKAVDRGPTRAAAPPMGHHVARAPQASIAAVPPIRAIAACKPLTPRNGIWTSSSTPSSALATRTAFGAAAEPRQAR